MLIGTRNWVFRKALPIPSDATTPSSPSIKQWTPPEPASSTTTTNITSNGSSLTRTLRQTPVTLFRFSALTFNPHKIHYSAPWAQEVEGHRDIVVHGPLNLISILDLWRDTRVPSASAGSDIGKAIPGRITYRATSPLYVEDEYRIVLEEGEGQGVGKVRILAPGDVVAMKAEIE